MRKIYKTNLKWPFIIFPIFIICCIIIIRWWFICPTTTTLVFVRHAEKTGNGQQDPLAGLGFDRADSLAYTVSYMDFDAIYATQYLRTKQTVQKVALEDGLTTALYNATADSLQVRAFLQMILNTHKGKRVLIAGHSNTVPLMLNILKGQMTYNNINELVFDNLYISPAKGLGNSQIYQLKYGLQNE